MTQEEWAKSLRDLVHKGGGNLKNGWTVEVKSRPTRGRDVKIRDTQGNSFRSVSQASAVLSASPKKGLKPKASPKKQKRTDTVRDGTHKSSKRRKYTLGARTDQAEAEDTVQKSKWVRKPKSLQSQAAEIETAVPCNDKKEHPVFGKLLRQARLHISRIRREMDILEVYDAEGWRGSNKDKLKPRAEMQRAQNQMSVSKEAVRGIVRQCEEGEGTALPSEDWDSDGGIDQLKIFCAICRNNNSTDENDIVLCDGPCRRAFHEKCCTPNLVSAELDEEADWLCPACYAKDEILDLLSEEFDTQYEIEDSADRLFTEDTFKNRAVAPLNGGQAGGTWASLLGGVDLVSSDTDDDSYRGSTRDEDSQQGADCEGAHLSRSPSKPCSSSDESDSESSEEEEVAEGKRQRVKVDYVAMNSQMFGEEVEEDSDQDYG